MQSARRRQARASRRREAKSSRNCKPQTLRAVLILLLEALSRKGCNPGSRYALAAFCPHIPCRAGCQELGLARTLVPALCAQSLTPRQTAAGRHSPRLTGCAKNEEVSHWWSYVPAGTPVARAGHRARGPWKSLSGQMANRGGQGSAGRAGPGCGPDVIVIAHSALGLSLRASSIGSHALGDKSNGRNRLIDTE